MSWKFRNSLATWAEGGDNVYTISVSGVDYRVHEFRTVGSSLLSVLQGGVFEYLVVAGGGAGGKGGGGAGGMLSGVITFNKQDISVTVGDSGKYISTTLTGITNGSNSSLGTSIISVGGGRGGYFGGITADWQSWSRGVSGGSGGGAGPDGGSISYWTGGSATVGQGNNGGAANISGAGGGGGAGSAGVNAISGNASGGRGLVSSITGTPVVYASGGSAQTGTSGTANTGNGGGTFSSGGTGIVIVRYAI